MSVVVGTSRGIDGAMAGSSVGPLAPGTSVLWAIVEGREIWRRTDGWEKVAVWEGPRLTCLQPTGGSLVVGTAEAHLLHLVRDRLEVDPVFDSLGERKSWYTPWGAPADVRSMGADGDRLFVNVHVGGILRRDEESWEPLVDIDVDVHQVVVGPDGSLLAATGAAGFGRSTDGGSSWSWDGDGLHGSYCRAVAVAGDQVLLSASTGPHNTVGAVYRRPLGAVGPWRRVSELVEGNVDTFWLAGRGNEAAFVTEEGSLWVSEDAGASWWLVGQGHLSPLGVAVLPADFGGGVHSSES